MALKVAVIGSGIGGIATAIRLAAKGYKVDVFEQAPNPGGKIKEFRINGFRFDTGPSLLTYPELIAELFALYGDEPKDYFQYIKLDVSCKYFWDDGTTIDAWQQPNRFALELEKVLGIDKNWLNGYLKDAERLYDIAGDTFIFHSLHKPANYLSRPFLKTLLSFPVLDPLRTLHQRNLNRLKHPKAVQIFDRYATYNGSNPYKTPATLRMIAHLEHNMGACFPHNGMYGIIESLVMYAQSKGVKFHYMSKVEKVLVKNRSVQGIKVHSKMLPFDIVVSDTDIMNFYNHLLSEYPIPKNQTKGQRSSSAIIFYWGVKKTFPTLQLHNILFANDYRKEFEHVFVTRTLTNDPTVYIFISSKLVEKDAPAGCENWFVMVNAPEITPNVDSNALVQQARSHVLEKIKSVLGVDISPEIVAESVAHPQSIERDTGSYGGSLYGLSSNNVWAAFNRHPNFSNKIKNLFFVGGSVHPGGGIPLCLASAKIVDNELPLIN
ncbi:MAG TPA: phytoene desaturase [Bacteroidales bacterium]|nr:phytoene desaturase [Bacteroidales bacterium]